MTSNLTDAINHYIEEPTELLVLENIRIGRMKLGRMVIRGRGAGYNALDVIGSAFEKTARVRSGKHGTRHLEPLPLCAPGLSTTPLAPCGCCSSRAVTSPSRTSIINSSARLGTSSNGHRPTFTHRQRAKGRPATS